jgi:hypothetical protein
LLLDGGFVFVLIMQDPSPVYADCPLHPPIELRLVDPERRAHGNAPEDIVPHDVPGEPPDTDLVSLPGIIGQPRHVRAHCPLDVPDENLSSHLSIKLTRLQFSLPR